MDKVSKMFTLYMLLNNDLVSKGDKRSVKFGMLENLENS